MARLLVAFGPYQNYSDPSYVLPLFYSERGCSDTANATFWNAGDNANFNYDAQRVPMNITMDFNLNAADAWQASWTKTMAAFWVKEGLRQAVRASGLGCRCADRDVPLLRSPYLLAMLHLSGKFSLSY